jgi:hypothetical protein
MVVPSVVVLDQDTDFVQCEVAGLEGVLEADQEVFETACAAPEALEYVVLNAEYEGEFNTGYERFTTVIHCDVPSHVKAGDSVPPALLQREISLG